MRLLRWMLNLGLVAGALAAAMFLLVLSETPDAPAIAPPSADDVHRARAALTALRDSEVAPGERVPVALSAPEIDSLVALGGRVVPGLRGAVALEDGAVAMAGALPVMQGRFWLNAAARVEDFEDGLRIAGLRVGRLEVPPDAALRLAVWLADTRLGDEAGTRVLAAFPAMAAAPGGVVLTRADSGAEPWQEPLGRDVARRVVGALHGGEMPSGPEVATHVAAIEAAFADGRLSGSGSFLPHLRFTLDRAYETGRDGDLARAYTAAILALTRVCGSEHIRGSIDAILEEGEALAGLGAGRSPCDEAGFHGRVDQRRHFITAAALRALSNRGVAVSIGEFKELSDMQFARNGFDFTDVAANNSGIRLSDRFMSAPAAEWPALLDGIATEDDVIVALDGIPPLMPRAEFEQRFGSIESAEYMAVLARIEARIDALPIHAPDR